MRPYRDEKLWNMQTVETVVSYSSYFYNLMMCQIGYKKTGFQILSHELLVCGCWDYKYNGTHT
jgi:hypothetical protein